MIEVGARMKRNLAFLKDPIYAFLAELFEIADLTFSSLLITDLSEGYEFLVHSNQCRFNS